MIGEVYCENRSHPEIILFIRRISAIRITESGPCFPSAIYLPVGISNFWERLILRYTSQLVLVQIYIHIMLCIVEHVCTYINAFCAQRLYFGDVHIILHILLLMNMHADTKKVYFHYVIGYNTSFAGVKYWGISDIRC